MSRILVLGEGERDVGPPERSVERHRAGDVVLLLQRLSAVLGGPARFRTNGSR